MMRQKGKSPVEAPLPLKTDLPFLQKPEWRKVAISREYQADFCILGKNILINRPIGYVTSADLKKSLPLLHSLIDQEIPKGMPYIQIEDYSNLRGAANDARSLFIKDMQNRKNLLALIFCNTSAFLRFSVNLGKRIYAFKFDIHLTKDLAEAVFLAEKILSKTDLDWKGPIQARPPDIYPVILRKDEWSYQGGDFNQRYELIDGDIIHVIASGRLKEEDIRPLFILLKKVFDQIPPSNRSYYLVVNLESVKVLDFKARRRFVSALTQWYREHPFKLIIFYNTNWVMHAIIRIIQTTVPYPVRILDGFHAVMEWIAADRLGLAHKEPANRSPDSKAPDQNQQYADELIRILAGINWDSQAPEAILRQVDPSHPFYAVVEAISLIKLDIDQLLRQRAIFEKALLESRRKYKEILDGIEEGYYETDLAGNITFTNPGLCRILGYSKEKLLGMSYRRLADKDQAQGIYQTFNQVYKTRRPVKAFDWKLIRGDSSTSFIDTSVSLIEDENGNPTGFRGIVRDITDRVAAETQRKSLEQQLRHAQKMEAIGTLAGGVAHDLNNILSGIVSYPELLLMKIPADSPLKKPLETIKNSGEKAAAIVSDLLTLARKGLPEQKIVNLNRIIQDYLNSPEHLNLLVHHPGVKIKTGLDDSLLNLNASPVHLFKIMINLVSNAAEAMIDGGTIHILTQNTYLDSPLPGYPAAREGEYVKLQIIDEGMGILPEDRERIFEPFFTKKKAGRSGSGLGMTLVWGAVQDHGGYIDVQSAPEKGTVVTIHLPATRTEPLQEAGAFTPDRFKGNGETILVVDDLKDQREIAEQMLTLLGYRVETASSGETALEFLKQKPVDLVILDMIMNPGMDGLDTYKGIKQIAPSQKTLIVTGFSSSERIKQAQALGAGACLKKPLLLENIARTVRETLGR